MTSNLQDSWATGFTYLLPYLEEDNLYRLYHLDAPWYDTMNYDPVGMRVKGFFCPSNRTEGSIDLAPIQSQWGTPMPPKAAACDYAFCKGANAGLSSDATKVPAAVRGVFNVSSTDATLFYVRLTDVTDGTSTTFAMGEAAGNSTLYPVATRCCCPIWHSTIRRPAGPTFWNNPGARPGWVTPFTPGTPVCLR